jgi:hypothetical protein
MQTMQKFFEIFGKIVIVIIILGSLTYAGYYLGTKSNDTKKPIATNDSDNATTEPKPVQTITPFVEVSGGVSKSVGLSFDQYTISIPNEWTSKKESQTTLDEKLILEKDGYSISIFQAATGGALCLYKGDADFEGPSSKFDYFVELTSKDGRVLRRSGEKNGTTFTVCQKSPDGSFQQPTNYGHISVKLPSAWDDDGLLEVDKIISSLKKI